MGKVFDSIPANIIEWIRQQEVFWVSTCPLAADGHINVSPKGVRGSFVVEGPNHVWYEDLSGSGCETIAHLRENGRITICFNALSGGPQIVRLYGEGTIFELGSDEYNVRLPPSKRKPGSRAVIDVKVYRVSTSCGFGVPYYKFEGHRVTMLNWLNTLEKRDQDFDADHATHQEGAQAKSGWSANGMRRWWDDQNRASIDGLPALEHAWEAAVPLGGSMPDPVEAGMLVRSAKPVHNSEKGPSEMVQVTKRRVGVLGNGNLKLAYGVVLGFLLAFAVIDLGAFVKTAMPV